MSATATLPALFHAQVQASGDRLALQEFSTTGLVNQLSWMAWEQESWRVAAALVATGIAPGERVAVLSANRNLWPVVEMGILAAGAVVVGIYPTAAVSQIGDQLADSGARVVVVDTPAQFERVADAVNSAAQRPFIVAPDDAAAAPSPRMLSWSMWIRHGESALDHEPWMAEELARRAAQQHRDDDALFIYTSGSTGEPKAARISHRCAMASAESIRDTLGLVASDSTMSVLPYCHAGEQMFGLATRLLTGMSATHVADYGQLWEACCAARPTVFGGLPRFFEKAYDALLATRRGLNAEDASVWDRELSSSAERARRRQTGHTASEHIAPESSPVRAAVNRLFGDRMRLATSGGAALPVRVAEYLDACGVTVLGAYGQTEHLCIAFNRPDRYRHDATGLAMPGTSLRIAEDGEVLVQRSALTFSGYHDRDDETRDAFTPDGLWLHTGDLGEMDADGMLRIVGRKKELIALSNGKKVAPVALERLLNDQGPIAHAVLHGEGRPFVTAVIALRDSYVETRRGSLSPSATYADVAADAAVRADVEAAIQTVNARFSRPEQVRRFVLASAPLTVEAGDLTPTMKVRRSAVIARYRTALDALYEESA